MGTFSHGYNWRLTFDGSSRFINKQMTRQLAKLAINVKPLIFHLLHDLLEVKGGDIEGAILRSCAQIDMQRWLL